IDLFFQSPTSSIIHFQLSFFLMHSNQLLSLLFIKNILFPMMNCPATDQFPISFSFQKFSNALYILACPTIYDLFHLCVLFKVLIAHSILLKLLYFTFTMIFFFPSTNKKFLPLFFLTFLLPLILLTIKFCLTLNFGIDGPAHSLLASVAGMHSALWTFMHVQTCLVEFELKLDLSPLELKI